MPRIRIYLAILRLPLFGGIAKEETPTAGFHAQILAGNFEVSARGLLLRSESSSSVTLADSYKYR